MDIQGRTAIVTGSGTGIGRAIALEFARQGANVVCCGRREDRLKETVALIEAEGGRALAIRTNVVVKSDVDAMIDATIKEYGQVDILFNNAGSFQSLGALWEVDPEVWWNDVTTNLLGPMLCSQAALPGMMERNEGIIINMDGGGSTSPLTGGSGYGCSKAALLRLTDTLAAELKKVGSAVLVFAMGPGFVRTEMTMLQVESDEGRRWIPSSKEAIDAGKTSPPELCAKSTMELIRIARPELSGRIFGAGTDFTQIAANAKEIEAQDLRVMRHR